MDYNCICPYCQKLKDMENKQLTEEEKKEKEELLEHQNRNQL